MHQLMNYGMLPIHKTFLVNYLMVWGVMMPTIFKMSKKRLVFVLF